MIGELWEIVVNFAFCCYAIFGVCVALSGYWHRNVPTLTRIAICAAAAVVLWPSSYLVNIAGTAIMTLLLLPDIKLSIQANKEKKASKLSADAT